MKITTRMTDCSLSLVNSGLKNEIGTKVQAFKARIDGISRGRRSPLAKQAIQTAEAVEAEPVARFICARDFPVAVMWRALHRYVCLWQYCSGKSMKGHHGLFTNQRNKRRQGGCGVALPGTLLVEHYPTML
jgi:hypothetical protein